MNHKFFSLLAALSLCAAQAFPAWGAPENAAGPGVSLPSPGDPYSTYQWYLENNGTFQPSRLLKKFYASSYSMGLPQNDPDSVYLPLPAAPQIPDEEDVSSAGIDINIQAAWDQYDAVREQGRDVIVALIDTGVDTAHPDLAGSLWTNPGEIPGDGIDNDGNGCIDDVHGWNFYMDQPSLCSGSEDKHGTHAAGIIAAGRDDGGITGIAGGTRVKVMVLKALGGPMGIGSSESVVRAIQYAEANGAAICNLSLSGSRYYENLDAAIRESNMLFVVAAGNGDRAGVGMNIDDVPVYPASFPYDNILSVAAVNYNGLLAPSSNYGAESVDIAAPGSYILSTIPDEGYAFFSGTSMAAPMVTATAALLYSAYPELSLADVKAILLQTARPLDSLNGKVRSGGMVDAGRALTWNQPAGPQKQ